MSTILLTTANARYSHSAFGLRYLLANLGPLRADAAILEFDIRQTSNTIVARLLAAQPRILGIGVYIWNVALIAQVIPLLRQARPDLLIVLGGPELAPDHHPELVAAANYVIYGEADTAFRELCQALLAGQPPAERIIHPPAPDLSRLELPYDEYSDTDIQNRLIYVESTRGCPFNCAYCLSSGQPGVRHFDLPRLLASFDRLLNRGVTQFKFINRSFNAEGPPALAILDFFLARLRPGLRLHFEIVPEVLQPDFLTRFSRFPAGALHFEIGIQTFNPEVAARVGRRCDPDLIEKNIRALRHETRAELHCDLIVGLPGESSASIAAGFARLVRLEPDVIQVNLLKRLPGTAIAKQDAEWDAQWDSHPPYVIRSHRLIPNPQMLEWSRFARYWELVVNRHRFPRTAPLIWQAQDSPFAAFQEFSRWLWVRFGRAHAIPLDELARALFEYLTGVRDIPAADVREALLADYAQAGQQRLAGLRRAMGEKARLPLARGQ